MHKWGKRWTTKEEMLLKRLVEQGKSDAEIARILGRSRDAVRQCRKKRLRIDRRVSWTDSEVERLKRLIAEGKPIPEIAKLMNRTETAIRGKKEDLKLRYETVKVCKDCAKTVAQIVKFKMIGWSNARIAKAFGLKQPSQISHVLRYNGFTSWKLNPKGIRTGIPTPCWTEVETHILRKCLKKKLSLWEIMQKLPRRSRTAIRLKSQRMMRWRLSDAEQAERQRARKKQLRVY